MSRAGIAALIVASALLVAPARRALAQEPSAQDYVTARALYNEGLGLEERGDRDGALVRFRGAWSSMRTPRTGYAYARSLARAGQLVEAFDVASATVALPESPNEPPGVKEDRAASQKLAMELRGRIPSVRIVVRGAPAGARVEVRVDGAIVPADAIGLARKVDPGQRRIAISTNGGPATESVVALAEGEDRVVTVDAPPTPRPVETAPPPPPERPQTPAPTWSTQKTLALVAGGVGVAALATGIVFGVRAKTLYSHAGDHCTGTVCDEDGIAKTDDARSAATISTIVTLSGVGFVALGAVLWLTAPRASVAIGPSWIGGPGLRAGAAW